MDRSDPFPRRTATPAALGPWILELARALPGLVASYTPGGPLDARTREKIILAVTEVNGCRYCAWIHGSWQDYLGEAVPARAEESLLTFARASADAGRPLDPAGLAAAVGPDTIAATRATVAQIQVANLVGNTVDGLLARITRKRPFDPVATALEAATVAIAIPVAIPMIGVGAALRAIGRSAPPLAAVEMPPKGEANLLVHLLAEAIPTYLANAAIRSVVLRVPVPVVLAIKAGRTSATVRLAQGRITLENGTADDAMLVIEGDVEPLLRLAAGSVVGQLSAIRVRPA